MKTKIYIAIPFLCSSLMTCKKSGSTESQSEPIAATTTPAAPTPGTIAVKPPNTTPSSTPQTQQNPSPGQSTPSANLTKMTTQIPLRPAMMVGTISVSGLTNLPTELSEFKEDKYIWNPAQIPLKELNKLVCVLSQTGFHLFPNQGKYRAKIIVEDCFKSDIKSAQEQSTPKPNKPEDVMIETTQAANGNIGIKVWFTRSKENILSNSPSTATSEDAVTWEPYKKLEMHYFIQATIEVIPHTENPFGVFDMKWEMNVAINDELQIESNNEPRKYQQGYVTTAKNPQDPSKVNLRYNQKNWVYNSNTCESGAFANYRGFNITTGATNTTYNGTNLSFDGSFTLGAVLSSQSVNTFTITATDNAIFPAGTVTFVSGSEPEWLIRINGSTFVFKLGNYQDEAISIESNDTVASFMARYSALQITLKSLNNVNCVTPFTDVNNCSLGSYATTSVTPNLEGNKPTGIFMQNGTSNTGLTITIDDETDDFNNLTMTFDGNKTLKQVFDEFVQEHASLFKEGIRPEIQNGVYTQFIFPAQTSATLSGGITPQASTTGSSTISLYTNGTDAHYVIGKKIRFDGIKTIAAAISDFKVEHNIPSHVVISTNNATDEIPSTMELTFTGTALKRDIYANTREFAASAEMTLHEGKPTRGKALTAENWSYEKMSTNCLSNYTYTPKPIKYGLAFDKNDVPNDANYTGRSTLKQLNKATWQTAASGYNPNAIRCEQIGGEIANVWQWAIFNKDGKRIHHRTDFPLFLENSINPWGDGWVSSWGTYVYSNVNNGQRIYILNADGSKKYMTIEKLHGTLYNSNWENVTTSLSSANKNLSCSTHCPTTTITQHQLDHQYDSTFTDFLDGQVYVYNVESKQLLLNGQPIKLADGASGAIDINLIDQDNPSHSYRYSLNSWNQAIALKDGQTYFSPPKKIVFDKSQIYTSAIAYPGTEFINQNHNNKSFSHADLLYENTDLSFQYGNICCFKWEEKNGIKDEWGKKAWASAITLRRGTELTIAGEDPDGTGPLQVGDKIKIAPQFTELRPLQKDDCSTNLESAAENIESVLSLPLPLSNEADRKISTKIGSKPTQALPILVQDGEIAK